ncbi:MAG: prephenate dehydrogenase [Frankiales bacterium]|nr:prephenate dehydrogenase [Frankiales bacterium]
MVGCGLIGTSLGLALSGTRQVLLHDADPASLQAAVARGAGRPWDGRAWASGPDDVVVLCVPVAATAPALRRLQELGLGGTFTHVASVQGPLQRQVEALGCDPSSLCGGHPMAGKATSGPGAAEPGLFAGRPWFLCPSPRTTPQAQEAVRRLASDVGADPVVTTAEAHDRTVALVSHLPQVVSSALAAQLLQRDEAPRYAGPGLVDTTRLAGSPVELWRQVLSANAGEVAPLLRGLADDLLAAADELDTARPDDALPVVTALLARGGRGRALVPVKRESRDRDLEVVRVELPDTPGRLVAVLGLAASAGVNVEDLRLEHVPGRPSGTVELLVMRDARPLLQAALQQAGERLVDDER